MQTSMYYEFERPVNWNGEAVDMVAYAGEVDYYECEIEANAVIEIDHYYGADADGNRGMSMDCSYVEDITINFDGDFRPLGRKVRDACRIVVLRTLKFFGVSTLRGVETDANWTAFNGNASFRFKGLGEEILSANERESIKESLLTEVEDWEPDYDPYDD